MDGDLPYRVKYWLNEAKHDCFFIVGPEEESTEQIGAIKALLMGDSEPFRAMLGDSELAETGDIRVKDVEPETFRTFLKCVYGASNVVVPKLSFEESAKLLYVVEKYLVEVIKSDIIDHMERLFSLEHVFNALSHPICYQTARLNTKIVETLEFNFEQITKDDQFLKLNCNTITWILQQESIFVNEIEIWNAILHWAKHTTGSSDGEVLRSCMYGFLKHIRFLTMDCDEFCEAVASTKILLEDEINDICKAFMFNKPCSIEHLCKSRKSRYNIWMISNKIESSIIKYPCQSFIHCSVSGVTFLHHNQSYCSKTYFWADHFWCLTVTRGTDDDSDKLIVYVWCRGTTPIWNCTADIEFSLINQLGKPNKIKKFTDPKTFYPSSRGWGVSMYEWNELLNPDNGFIKNNSIILQVRILV